jgi:RNA polymerase sigma-70 factor (ECF subfamily)
LYRAVRNRVLNAARHNNYRKKYEADLEVYLKQGHCATDDMIALKELTIRIEREIALLPKKMRIVFEMSRKEYMTREEIAENIKKSPGTVKSHITGALKILRDRGICFICISVMSIILMMNKHY